MLSLRRRRSLHGVDVPRLRHALELAGPDVDEGEASTGDEVADRAGHEDLARLGDAEDPGAEVHSDAADLLAHRLDLAGVDASADLDSESSDGIGGLDGTGDGVRGLGERREEPVTGRVDLAPVM